MFQDEKTTELDLSANRQPQISPLASSRWTEQAGGRPFSMRASSPAALSQKSSRIEPQHIPWILKLAAAVSILILSLWLF